MTARHTLRFAVLGSLTLLAGACGGAEPEQVAEEVEAEAAVEGAPTLEEAGGDCAGVQAVISEAEALRGQEREDFLLARALETEDGLVSFYTELNSEDTVALTDLFEERYDGLTLSVFRAGSDQVRQRLLEEAEGDFRAVDAIEIEALEMIILEQAGLLAPVGSPFAEEVIEAGRFENFTADRVTYIVPVWNTELLPGDPPQSFEDLADPRFEGVMALEDSDVYWFAVLVTNFMAQEGMTEDEAVDVFRRIAANSDITHGHTTTLELVLAGQYAITANGYTHRTQEFKAEGAPLEWVPVNVPVVAESTAISVACNAVNPAGALLMEDFVLNPEGLQQYFVEVNRTPANLALQEQSFGPGVEVEPIDGDVEAIVADYERWGTLWDEVVRGQ